METLMYREALFSFAWRGEQCQSCSSYELNHRYDTYAHYYDEDDDYDNSDDCTCTYHRVSICPLVDPQHNYEGRYLDSLPQQDGKHPTEKTIKYRIIFEKPQEESSFSEDHLGTIEHEFYFDMAIEYADADDFDMKFFKMLNRSFNSYEIRPIKVEIEYLHAFIQKINRIVKLSLAPPSSEKKENPHVKSKGKKK